MEGYRVSGTIIIEFPSGTFTFQIERVSVQDAIELIDLIRSSLALGTTMTIDDTEKDDAEKKDIKEDRIES